MSGYVKHAMLLLALGGLTGLPSAQAVEMLRLSDGIGTATIIDNGPGDLSPALGVISYSASSPNWVVSVTTGVSKPVLGDSVSPSIHLDSVNVSSLLGGTLTIQLTDTGFGPSPGLTALESDIGGVVNFAPGSSLSYTSYLDTSNTPFGTDTLLSSLGSFGPGAFAGSAHTPAGPLAGPYSLTLEAVITHPAQIVGASSFDATLHNNNRTVPDAGSSLLLLGSSLVALGCFAPFRKRLTC